MKNFAQKHEVDYAKEKVRPEVEEEVALHYLFVFLIKNKKLLDKKSCR